MCIATVNAATEMKMYSQNNKGAENIFSQSTVFPFPFHCKNRSETIE